MAAADNIQIRINVSNTIQSVMTKHDDLLSHPAPITAKVQAIARAAEATFPDLKRTIPNLKNEILRIQMAEAAIAAKEKITPEFQFKLNFLGMETHDYVADEILDTIQTKWKMKNIDPMEEEKLQLMAKKVATLDAKNLQDLFNRGNKEVQHTLRYHARDLKLTGKKSTEEKLSKELLLANVHMQKQRSQFSDPLDFKKLSQMPCNFPIHTGIVKLPTMSAGIAHAQGQRLTMEDVHIASFGNFAVDPPTPYEMVGIIDGHGGDETAKFVAAHIQEEIEKAVQKHGISDDGIRMALNEAFVQLDAKLACKIGETSGAAAVISLKIGSNLWTANVGDCRAILKVGKNITQLSEDAKPETPRFKKSIEKRGGTVVGAGDTPRVNGVLSTGRAFGDKGKVFRGKDGHYVVSPRPKITKIDLQPYQDECRRILLILACDGIWDVATSREAGTIVGKSPQEDAKGIVRAALNGKSSDNCSALVAEL